MIVLLVREIERARGDGEVHPEVDAFYSAMFFLLGIYGVLSTTDRSGSRDTMLEKLVASAVRGLEVAMTSFVLNPSTRRSDSGLRLGDGFGTSRRGAGPG